MPGGRSGSWIPSCRIRIKSLTTTIEGITANLGEEKKFAAGVGERAVCNIAMKYGIPRHVGNWGMSMAVLLKERC